MCILFGKSDFPHLLFLYIYFSIIKYEKKNIYIYIYIINKYNFTIN